VSTEAQQVGELLGALDLSPGLHARLDAALRAAEADQTTSAAPLRRAVEQRGDPLAREAALRRLFPNDPDAFLRAWQAGS
jgi:hypothetical protein